MSLVTQILIVLFGAWAQGPLALPDPPQIGLLSAECVVTLSIPVDVPATIDGGEPFEIPPDVVFTTNAINRANRFHIHWLPPNNFDDTLTVVNYELTLSTLDGAQVTQVLVDPDVRQGGAPGNNFHMPVDAADPGDVLVVQNVVVFEDADGNAVRSQPGFYPPTSLACCPGGHPPPKILPELINREDSNSELDGGVYQVTSGTTQFTYFCNEGIYKSCFMIPEGFSDPNNNRYQEIGGVAVFRDNDGSEVSFQCIFNPAGNGGEQGANDVRDVISGRYIRLPSDASQSPANTTLSEQNKLRLAVIILSVVVGVFAIAILVLCIKRRRDIAKFSAEDSAKERHRTESELLPTQYDKLDSRQPSV